jgi:hypothetical protein
VRKGKKEKGKAGKNYLDFFWMRMLEALTLASQKKRIHLRKMMMDNKKDPCGRMFVGAIVL